MKEYLANLGRAHELSCRVKKHIASRQKKKAVGIAEELSEIGYHNFSIDIYSALGMEDESDRETLKMAEQHSGDGEFLSAAACFRRLGMEERYKEAMKNYRKAWENSKNKSRII